ncbi:hypothetical protein Efla_007264 [Eimeria flavescens]
MECGRCEAKAAAEDGQQQRLRFECLREFKCGSSSVNCVRFFVDADHALAGTSDRTVYLLSAQHGILHEFVGEHTDVVSCVGCAHALSDLFLSGGLDRRGILWNVTSGEAVRQFPRTSPIHACLLRPSPNPLTHVAAIGDAEGRVRLFDIRSQTARFGYVQVLADAKDGISRQATSSFQQTLLIVIDKLLVASLDGCLYTYDLRKGALHADCYGSPITCLSLSADETVLLASCVDASVRLIEADSGECLHAFWGHRQTAAGAFRICSDFLISSRRLPDPSAAAALFSPSSVAAADEPPKVLDELLEVVQRSSQAAGGMRGEMAAQLPYAVSGSEDCCVYFWDVHAAAASGEEEAASGGSSHVACTVSQQGVHARAHDAPVLVVKTDTLSQRLCTAATDGTVKLWRQR